LFYVQVVMTLLVPVPLWAFRRFRRSVAAMFWASIAVNIGMFLERYLLVVTPLSYKQAFVFTWYAPYQPRLIEYVLSAAAFALVIFGILAFAKLFPIVPIWDVKEGQVVQRHERIGRAKVATAIRE
jgi:molybdopterin-containing oxidoreductase family membrane subunit